MPRPAPTLIGSLTLALALTGCATATDDVVISDDTIVLDVRTPQEYAEGHLEGAQLLDLTGGQLAAALPDLDADAEYVVYCRSGNRSAQAATMLEEAGFENVTDLGSIEDAADATDLPVVS